MRARLLNAVTDLWLPLGVVAVWWVASADSESTFFPPLSDILSAFADTWLFERVPTDLLPSVERLAAGVAIGVGAGVAAGVAIGMSPTARRALTPAMEFMRAIPAPALVPAFIVLVGVGNLSKILLIALGVLWPVLLNAIDGVRAIDPTVRDMARVYGLPRRTRILRVMLPAAMPQIFTGMRIGLALGLVVMVISEMTASTNGLGFFIIQAQQSFAITEMWTGIIMLGLLGLAVNVCFVLVEHRALAWHRGWRLSTLGEAPPRRTASRWTRVLRTARQAP